MGEFFNGWRRLLGCLLLVGACAVAGLMLRSQSTGDVIEFPFWKCGHKIDTGNGHFLWLCRWFPTGGDMSVMYSREWSTYPIDRTYTPVGETLLEKLGFYFNANRENGILELVIPYWSVVVLLGVPSIWLILRKPRRPGQTAAPNAEHGTTDPGSSSDR
jgi:hypothetical protein